MGKEARQRGWCERRPGGNLGKLRAIEQTSRDPHRLPGFPSTSPCSYDFYPQPSPRSRPFLCLCPCAPETPLGPALTSPIAPAGRPCFPGTCLPDGAALLLTVLLLQPSLPPHWTHTSCLHLSCSLPCAAACAPIGSSVLEPFLPESTCSSYLRRAHALGRPARAGAAQTGNWLLLPFPTPFPSTGPMSPKFQLFLGRRELALFLLPSREKTEDKWSFN